MKAYIQTDQFGDFYNVNAFVAATGFKSLGFDIKKFTNSNAISDPDPAAIFVGGVGMVRKRLSNLGIEQPKEIEYPETLKPFLNRKIWKANLNDLISEERTGLFIKPVLTKLFQGKLINRFGDYIGLKYEDDVEVWCSDPIALITEWRCFIRYGEILDVRYYKGKWDSQLDLSVIKAAVAAYSDQPNAYCLDFGVDSTGQHYLVEVNDGHSLGTYGMGAISYAKFLSARWAELTQTTDQLNF